MNSKYYFYITLIISVIIQFLTGLIDILAVFTKVPTKHILIKQLLILELFVQIIEGSFYIWLVYNLNTISNITPKRYIDWCMTTPTMLITLIMYLIYLKDVNTKKLDFLNLLIENSSIILYIIFLNLLMLIFGFLGEIKIISTLTSVILGFIPFLIYFFMIYINYAIYSGELGIMLYWYFFFFWSLYGIAALFPYYIKNMFYNILDLFAKNFFGLFLGYIVLTQSY